MTQYLGSIGNASVLLSYYIEMNIRNIIVLVLRTNKDSKYKINLNK